MRLIIIGLVLALASIGMTATTISDNAAYKNDNSATKEVNKVNISYEGVDLSKDNEFSALKPFKEGNKTYFKDATFKGGFILKGTEYGHLYKKWDTIRNRTYNDSTYLALIDNYEWLTKHDDYTWSNDANYCYIDYRNKKLGLLDIIKIKDIIKKERKWIFTGSDLFFVILLLILLIIFSPSYFFFNNKNFCINQAIVISSILPLSIILIMVSFSLDKTWDLFSFISSGYGRRPLYTIAISLLVIVIFSLPIYWRCLTGQGFWRSFWLSAAIFFSAPIKDEDQNKSDKKISNEIGPLAVIERALGWILLAIFIATLSNVVVIRSGLS